jgi:hypothetical protein
MDGVVEMLADVLLTCHEHRMMMLMLIMITDG